MTSGTRTCCSTSPCAGWQFWSGCHFRMKRSGRKSLQVHSRPLHPLFLDQFSRTCLEHNFFRKICDVKLKSSHTRASRYQVFQITEVAVQLFQPGFDSVLFFVQFFQLLPVGCLGLAWRRPSIHVRSLKVTRFQKSLISTSVVSPCCILEPERLLTCSKRFLFW